MKTLIAFDNKKHLLSYDSMDKTHMEFVDLYNSVETFNDESLKNGIIKLIHHSKRHFDEEELLMKQYAYPRIQEHKTEHDKVLNEMAYFLEISRSRFGLKMLKSYYLQKLPEWFDLHLMSMDSDLASFLKTKVQIEAN